MKQIVQNYKRGSLHIEELPEPLLQKGSVLVQTYHSLISAGTEKMKIDDSKKSYLGMAKARPDQVKQLLGTLKQQGPISTYRKVMNRLDSYTPLGYSLAGKVLDVGEGVTRFAKGDMVACAGADVANHAEINCIPLNLCSKLPRVKNGVKCDDDGYLSTEYGAFTTVGTIAMQGVRQAEVQVGENVVVIGLGLVGLVTCLILQASGCRVMGIDIDDRKIDFARKIGVDLAVNSSEVEVVQTGFSFSAGYGADSVIITTGTSSNQPIITAGQIARDRAIIVDVGINKMDVPWQLYFSKELVLKQSRSYGPGRYDPEYEMEGKDYPIGYVRWTENRNMESFLSLMSTGKIDVEPLITHRFDFENGAAAYDLIEGEGKEPYVGIILKYDQEPVDTSRTRVIQRSELVPAGGCNIGLIGAGNYARTMLLPHLKGDVVNLVGVATSRGISAKDTARKFNFDLCTTDYAELLGHKSINTIMVATRHNLHAQMVVEALAAGKHVYAEKPLCLNESELADIEKCYRDHQECLLMVGFNRRFSPLVQDMKDFFKGRTEPMVMSYRVNAGFKEKHDWYQQKDIGGGRIIGEVCHFIDTFQYMTDALPVSVFAQSIVTANDSITPEDNIIINIGFSDGSIGAISYLANGDPQFPKEYIEIFCENRVAVLDNFSVLQTMKAGRKKVKKSVVQDKGQKNEMRALVDAVLGKTDSPISFESIYATTLATFRIHDSLTQGELVQV